MKKKETLRGGFFAHGGMGLVAASVMAVAAFLQLQAKADQILYSWSPAPSVSYSSASSGTALVSAMHVVPTTSILLESRYQTWGYSGVTALRSDKIGIVLVIF